MPRSALQLSIADARSFHDLLWESRILFSRHNARRFSTFHHGLATDKTATAETPDEKSTAASSSGDHTLSSFNHDEEGAMTRRLSSLTSSNLDPSNSSTSKVIEDAGFNPQLKEALLQRIASASPRAANPQAFAEAESPSSVGTGSRFIAASQPWTGTESIHDSSLRMLDDSYKRIRVPSSIPKPAGIARPPKKVDTGRPPKTEKSSSGARLASARERSSMYAYLKDESLSKKERDQLRAELKERFSPGARPMPTTIQGSTLR